MKCLMPMIALLCAASLSAQSLDSIVRESDARFFANPIDSETPIAGNDEFKAINGQAFDLAAPGVLGNDSGQDLLSVLYQPVEGEAPDYQPQGMLTLYKDGALHYEPLPGFEGVDEFIYFAIDANGIVAKATIRFYCFNDGTTPPVLAATEDEFKALSNETLDVPAPGVLTNDMGSGLKAALMDMAGLADIELPHGTLTLNSDGSFSYVPVPGFTGVDTFYYLVTDETGNCAKCTVSFYCYTEGSDILAAEPLAIGEPAGEEAGSCTAGAGAAPWLLLPMIGLALMRLRRARA